jgi:hypothetical protein
MTNWEIGGGQYWHSNYDPFDSFTLADAHAPIPNDAKDEIAKGNMTQFLLPMEPFIRRVECSR